MDALGGISAEVEKHPGLFALAIGLVAILAYVQSRNSGPTYVEGSYAGGGTAAPIDPAVAAIEQARINAGAENVQTLASLVGLENTNQNALSASLAQTGAARDVSLAQTAAERDAALAGIAAQHDVADRQINANETLGLNAQTVDLATANINAAIQAQSIAANQDVEKTRLQFEKDMARAQDNTNLATEFFHGVVNFATALFA